MSADAEGTDLDRAGSSASAASAEPPLIDAHAHVFRLDTPMPESAWHRPSGEARVEDFLVTLDRAGVVFAVLSAASIFGDYNDYMVEASRAHPRLKATAIVPPDTDPYILRRMQADGVVGVRLQFRSSETTPDLTGYEYQRFFRRIADLGWHVHLHDRGERLARHVPAIEGAGPRLVIDHFGRPPGGADSEAFRGVLEAVQRGRTWVKLSAAFRLEPPRLARELTQTLLRTCGPERLVWGSDWPFVAFEDRVTYDAVLATFYENVPDPAVRRAIDRTGLAFYLT